MNRIVAGILFGLVALGSLATSASAAETHPFQAAFGSFQNIQGLAVDQGSGDVYVLDAGGQSISRFDASGNPVGFSASAPYIEGNRLTGTADGAFGFLGGESETQIAVAPAAAAGGTAGDIYVTESASNSIAIFAPSGAYLGKIDGSGNANPTAGGTLCGVAVDPSGALYLGYYAFPGHVDKYVPSASPALNSDFDSSILTGAENPVCQVAASGSTLYASHWPAGPLTAYPLSLFPGGGGEADASGSGVVIEDEGAAAVANTVAVDPSNGDLYVDEENRIAQFAAGGSLLGHSGTGEISASHAAAVDGSGKASDGNLYAGDGGAIDIFGPGVVVPDVTTAAGFPGTDGRTATVAGFLNPAGLAVSECIFQYGETETYGQSAPCSALDGNPISSPGEIPADANLHVATAELSGLQPATTYHFRFVAANANGTSAGKDLTFQTAAPPTIEATFASEVGESEATLEARINSRGLATKYRFEYGTDASYGNSAPIPDGDVDPADIGQLVRQRISGLAPGTEYHYRVVAYNSVEPVQLGPDRVLRTESRPSGGPADTCPNALLRAENNSTRLPDCRAYELVSPRDTNGTFLKAGSEERDNFGTPLASPDGNSVIFYTTGALAGTDGNGTRDGYEAVRGAGGWSTRGIGPSGAQATVASAGGTTPDHAYAFWFVGPFGGSLDTGKGSNYLRGPDGGFELVGLGSLGSDPGAVGRWISPGAAHVIFTTATTVETTAVQLEPNAPPTGIAAIYDRRPGAATQVVSLLPGNVIPSSDSTYLGASEDGSAVVFEVAGTMYERRGGTTYEVASGSPGYQGISHDGSRVFYSQGGDVFAYEPGSGAALPIGSGGESIVVNVSADGSHVYFSSPLQLDGAKGQAGARNLYVWDGASVRFVSVLAESDFHEFASYEPGISSFTSLAEWENAIGPRQTSISGRAQSPTRTTADGSVLVFQSHGVAGYPYDSEGRSEVYRYDDRNGAITCISCSPTNAAAASEAELQSTGLTVLNAATNATSLLQNVTADGETVFFQTGDALVAGDTNGVTDVYEWRQGQVALISSGRSGIPTYLYGMTPDGSSVFFKTSEALVPGDETGGSGSIYDARIGGGFAAATGALPCSEGACQGQGTPPPGLPSAGSDALHGPANAKPRHHRKKHRHRKHRRKKQHHEKRAHGQRAGANRGGVR